jgi:NitT/TauT family transport system substrate-binding protein
MKRRDVLKMLAAPALVGLSSKSGAQGRQRITYAYLLDPAYDAVTWAMTNGKIPSDSITVEARGLLIPQLIQATSAKQYDVIQTAVIGIPPAVQRGLDLRVMGTAQQAGTGGEGAGLYVKKDSPIKSPRDLKGKTLGTFGLRSTGHTLIRIALTNKYKLDVPIEGGDVRQVEIQAPNLPAALSTGQVDAAALINTQAFRGLKSGDFRSIAETAKDNTEMFGMRFISAVNVGYQEAIVKRPAAYREFNRMFRESARYAMTNRKEVFAAVGAKSNLEPAFFDWWFDKAWDVPGTFTEEHARAVMRFYELSRDIGALKAFPDIRGLVSDQALTA